MHLHWLILFIALTTVYGQSKIEQLFSIKTLQNIFLGSRPATPLFLRGLWCLAKWSQSSSTYMQTGQTFFYNNGTFTFNYLDNPSSTWVRIFHSIIITILIYL